MAGFTNDYVQCHFGSHISWLAMGALHIPCNIYEGVGVVDLGGGMERAPLHFCRTFLMPISGDLKKLHVPPPLAIAASTTGLW